MKTRFSRRRNFLPAGTHIALLIAGICIALLLILRFVFPGALTALAVPFWQIGSALSSSMLSFENAQKVADERTLLKEQVEALQNENTNLKTALADLGVLERADGDVTAGVLARPPLTPYDVLIVNRGTRHGVTTGVLAYAKGGVPVGVVADASQDTSRIALFSSSGRLTDAWVGEERIPVTLHGEGAGAFTAEVPRDTGIVSGDSIYVAGGGARAIGTVSEVQSEASSPHAVLLIHPLVSPFSISWIVLGQVSL